MSNNKNNNYDEAKSSLIASGSFHDDDDGVNTSFDFEQLVVPLEEEDDQEQDQNTNQKHEEQQAPKAQEVDDHHLVNKVDDETDTTGNVNLNQGEHPSKVLQFMEEGTATNNNQHHHPLPATATTTGIPVNLYNLTPTNENKDFLEDSNPMNTTKDDRPPPLSSRLSSFFSIKSYNHNYSASTMDDMENGKKTSQYHNKSKTMRPRPGLANFFHDETFAQSVQQFNKRAKEQKSQRNMMIRHLTRKDIRFIDDSDHDDDDDEEGADGEFNTDINKYKLNKINEDDDDDDDDDEDAEEMAQQIALKRRLRDFHFARKKRKEFYGERSPFGIFGLYDHLVGIRTDIEWSMDAAWRRDAELPYLSWQDFEELKDAGCCNKPFFTYFVLLVCTITLIVSFGLNGWKVQPLTENPMVGPSGEVLVRMGAKVTAMIVNDGEWYRIVTAMFLHAGIIHYVMNMIALWFLGPAIEQSHGILSTIIIFSLAGIGGNLLSAIFLAKYISVGASGGIFGLIGACLADIFSNWSLLFSEHVNDGNKSAVCRNISVLLFLVLDIFLNVVIGLTPFIDNYTHMGGMFFGFLCGLSTMKRVSTEFFGEETHWTLRLRTFLVRFVGVIFTVICIVTAATTLASLGRGQLYECKYCIYVSCVPFPFWVDDESKWWTCDV